MNADLSSYYERLRSRSRCGYQSIVGLCAWRLALDLSASEAPTAEAIRAEIRRVAARTGLRVRIRRSEIRQALARLRSGDLLPTGGQPPRIGSGDLILSGPANPTPGRSRGGYPC